MIFHQLQSHIPEQGRFETEHWDSIIRPDVGIGIGIEIQIIEAQQQILCDRCFSVFIRHWIDKSRMESSMP